MVSVCLPSDALLQHLPSYLGFSYLGQAAATGALSADVRSYPMSEVRGGGREEQFHVQGAVASWAQESLEELLHVQGQEGRE